MVMNFDNYSTSFQSLMSPTYNVMANYNAVNNGNNGYYGGYSSYGFGNYNGFGYGGFISPMSNVGIGQFTADYLIKDDDRNNNYYTRPIAVHKKKDETGTILGIIGTALGTAALLLSLRKGRRPSRAVTNPTNPVNPVRPANPVNPVHPTNPTNPVNPGGNPVNPQGTNIKGYLPPYTGTTTTVNTPAGGTPVVPTGGNQVNPGNTIVKGLLPPHVDRRADAIAKQQAAMNQPSSGVVYTPPEPKAPAGLLPQHTATTPVNPAVSAKPNIGPLSDYLPKPQQTFNIPQQGIKGCLPASTSSNLPVHVPSNRADLGPIENYLPKQQQTFNIPQQGIKGCLPASTSSNLPVHVPSNRADLGPIENYLPKQQQTFNIPQQGGTKGLLPPHEYTIQELYNKASERLMKLGYTFRPKAIKHLSAEQRKKIFSTICFNSDDVKLNSNLNGQQWQRLVKKV